MKLHQRGFTAVLPIVVVAILVVAGAVIYVSKRSNSPEPNRTSQGSAEQKSQDTQTTQTASTSNEGYMPKIEIAQPAGWTSSLTESEQGEGTPIFTRTFTSPSGTKLFARFDYGGYGGMCEPVADDVPHALNNACATSEYVSVEELQQKVSTEDGLGNKGNSPLLLVKKRYTTDKHQYLIGLIAGDASVETGKPTMGFDLPFIQFTNLKDDVFKGYIYLYAISENSSFFSNQDGQAVIEALRNVKITQ